LGSVAKASHWEVWTNWFFSDMYVYPSHLHWNQFRVPEFIWVKSGSFWRFCRSRLCMYIYCMYVHILYVCTYIVCMYIYCMYVHILYVCTYIVCMYIHCMYVHIIMYVHVLPFLALLLQPIGRFFF
jgi:hypothetical protein